MHLLTHALRHNRSRTITWEVAQQFMDDCSRHSAVIPLWEWNISRPEWYVLVNEADGNYDDSDSSEGPEDHSNYRMRNDHTSRGYGTGHALPSQGRRRTETATRRRLNTDIERPVLERARNALTATYGGNLPHWTPSLPGIGQNFQAWSGRGWRLAGDDN